MNSPLPSEIEVVEQPDGLRYRLPRRPARWLRRLGLGVLVAAPIIFGLQFFFRGLGGGFANVLGGVPGPNWFFILESAVGLAFALLLTGGGLFLFAGHSEIELRDGRLLAVEQAGPLRWIRRRSLERIRRFVVYTPQVKINGQPADPGVSEHLTLINAECDRSKTLWLAPGYPRAWLRPLADDLARSCQAVQARQAAYSPPPTPVIEQSDDESPAEFPDRLKQPPGSKTVLERRDDGVTLSFPPQELGLAGGLMIHSMIGSFAFAAAVTALVASAGLAGPWWTYLFLGIFWLPGLALLLYVIHKSRQRITLAVTGDTLTFIRTGLFGERQRSWSRAELSHVGIVRDEKDQPQLQVQLKPAKKVDLLTGLDRAELEWAATVLRQALRVQAANPLARPAGCQVVLQRHADGLTLLVPPAGLWRGSGGLLFVCLAWLGLVAPITVLAFASAPWSVRLFLMPFWAAGIGLLLWAINRGRRRAVLAIVGDRLMVFQSGIFGGKRGEWSRAQIARVCAGPSGEETNSQPVLELQIHPQQGKKFGLLAGRETDELRWLASVLRQALHVPETTGSSQMPPKQALFC